MQRILFLAPLYFLLFSITAEISLAETVNKANIIKTIAAPADKQQEKIDQDKELAATVNTLDSNVLDELSDTTKTTLEEKKKDINKAVVEGQQALLEKKAIQNKVEAIEKQLEETKSKIETSVNQPSQKEIKHLKEKSRQLEKEYQSLQTELQLKDKRAKKAFEESSRQQGEIEQLKTQLHQLEIEKNKRYSPRKKAMIMGSIIIITLIILFIKDKLVGLFEKWLIYRGNKGQTVRALRARTFLRIFSWAISILIIAIAIFMILELFGFDSTTTLAGAGVFSVAIGFGAQQFIKDIFSGLFLVLEGQYGVNDYIAVGKYSGNVEDINLRFTKLRNYDGNVVYIPNGDIHSVTNYGKGYANSVIKFYVDITQEIEPVFTLIREVISELRAAPDLVDEILSDTELLGINAFTATGIEIKFRLKTAPQSQWLVGREVRLALKQRFDLDGIKLFQFQHNSHPVQE